ncbi:MAG: sulfatase [Bacteroidota bacterium]|nr:sulfatase [Bacteroidota bacterium]
MINFIKYIIIPLLLLLSNNISNNEVNISDKPNFIFYLSDDQDQLDYSIYGNDLVESSAVEELASKGMVFNNFYTAQAICSPSRSQLLTGMYPVKNGCYANHIPVKSNISSITKYLKQAGYDVYLAGKSHVKPSSVFNWSHYFPLKDKRYFQLNKIKDFITNAKKPYCIFIASTFPHGPFINDQNYTKKDVLMQPYEDYIPNFKPSYYSNIKKDNDQLQQVLNIVDSVDNENIMFFYASDHGISGKWGVYEKGLRAPLVIRWPKNIKEGTRYDGLLSFVDIMPTILDIAGAEIPKDIDGKSFADVFINNNTQINKYVYGVGTKQNVRDAKIFPSRSIRDEKFKYIINFNSIEVYENNFTDNDILNQFIEIGAKAFPNTPYEELYDLSNDPYEKNNIANSKEFFSIKRKLNDELRKWMKDQNDFVDDGKIAIIKPTLHPLDKESKWTKVPEKLIGKIKDNNYIKSHY